MKEELKISVIIPVYNIKDYLKRCVDTIINQTYRNLEIILVDDGSTDGSSVLCDQLAEQDARIIVIHKKNGGLSDARNVGIDKASGEVISFIDGDDYVDCNMYEVMMQALGHNISLVVCGRTVLDYSSKSISSVVYNKEKNVLLSKEECFRAFLSGENNGFTVSCCNKIFRRELFDDIRFTKGLVSEDIECLYRILDKVENCVCVKENLYIYAIRNGSLSRNSFSEQQMKVINIVQQVREFIESKYPELKMIAYRFELEWLIVSWKLLWGAKGKVQKKWKKEIRNRIKCNLVINGERKELGNYLFVMSYAILLGVDKVIDKGFDLWFSVKKYVAGFH